MRVFDSEKLEEIEQKKKEWEDGPVKKSLDRFGIKENPNKFYTPSDIKDHQFLEKVGFPGELPYTAGIYAMKAPGAEPGFYGATGGGLVRVGAYSGYGTAENTRDFYQQMAAIGRPGGPNIAFDLPTQLGYDSDNPLARGEVGKVGVAVDTLREMEVIYEAFTGDRDLDKIASNWTINAPVNIILAMYIALAEQRGIPQAKLRGTPQNDILKEFVARGTYIFPIQPSMRMTRDTITYCTENMPLLNTISICGYHIREAGATAAQVIALTLSNAIAYVQLGIDAGLEVDAFIPRFTFLNFGGSMELFKEVALQRAARRMWARIMKEKFGAKNPRSWILRPVGWARSGEFVKTRQRPLNNLTRHVIGGVADALSGGDSPMGYPYDEPLGLGHSLEGWQLNMDANRIIRYEARLCDVSDPLAGSYYVEALTDQVEAEAQGIMDRIDAMGGAAAAIGSGFYQQQIAQSAYQFQREVESGERIIVGINAFTGEQELEVSTSRLVPHPYDAEKRAEAEQKQLARLREVKQNRNNQEVTGALQRLQGVVADERVNLIPVILEAVKSYATIGEICGVLREEFGEYKSAY